MIGVTKLLPKADVTDTSAEMTLVIDGYDDYAETLKSYRKEHNMKQIEFAKLLGVNPYTLRSWEQGKAKPPYHVWREFRGIVKDTK